jgi:hypothetical protein
MSESGFTLIDASRAHQLPARVDAAGVRIAPEALGAALGWQLQPEGLCRGDACVPVRDRAALVRSDEIDLAAFAELLGQPLALDTEERAAALGSPCEERRRELASPEAPDFTLPDLEGRLHSLSEQRGKKVLLIAYASW